MRAKIILCFSFILITLVSVAQQKGFADWDKYNKASANSSNKASIYITPGEAMDTSGASLTTEYMQIDFSFDPESSDELKENYINKLMEDLKKLPGHYGTGLKGIRFQIGEQIFLTKKEVEKFNSDYSKMAKANLKKAWERMSPELLKMYPNATLYADNWGW